MKCIEISERSPMDITSLLHVWEDSVRATHRFLSDSEIRRIRQYVPAALMNVERLVAAIDDHGAFTAFMGIQGKRLEMLFIAPPYRGKGLGKQLIRLAVLQYGIRETTVNEQNPQALGFYTRMGFETCGRSEHDEEGNPYPLLYLKLADLSTFTEGSISDNPVGTERC